MNFLFLGNLGQGEIIIIAVIGIIVLILPVLLILLICGAFTSFPPDPQTLDTSKWRPIVIQIRNGVILYLIAGIIGTLFELFDTIQDFQSLFSASSPEEFFKTWMSNSVDILSGATLANLFKIIGFILYYTGLGEFSTFHQDNTTNYKITRLQSAAICGIVAIVLDYIPVIGGLASWIMTLVMYFIMTSAFSYLRYSPVFNTKAKAGGGLLKTANVMYIIGMFLPCIGSFFNLLGFFMTIIGWGRIANGGPIAPGYVPQPQNQTQPVTYLPPTPVSSLHQEDSETILDQHWMYCSKCGTKCKDYLKFCPRCGFALHPEREEPSSEDSSYAPPVRQPEQPECNLVKNDLGTVDKIIPETDNLSRPLVTKTGGVIHVENTVHPTVESHPNPSLVIVKEQKKASLAFSVKDNKLGMWALIAFAVLLIATIPAYLFWYKPYAINRDAPRYYTFTNLNLRSSQSVDNKDNIIKMLPYGTELITYGKGYNWARVKADGVEGHVAASLILTKEDFNRLDNVWGNEYAKERVGAACYRLAVIDYLKRNDYPSGSKGWQIFAYPKGKINTVFQVTTKDNKYGYLFFILKNNQTQKQKLVLYYIEDKTDTPVFQNELSIPDTAISSISTEWYGYRSGRLTVFFTDGTHSIWDI